VRNEAQKCVPADLRFADEVDSKAVFFIVCYAIHACPRLHCLPDLVSDRSLEPAPIPVFEEHVENAA
jgi:hypothetical protein